MVATKEMINMSGWAYGLVEDGEELLVSEVFFDIKEKPFFFVPICLDDLKKDKKLVMKDLNAQAKANKYFVWNNKKKELEVRKWKE
jgi:hypothetical protein